MLPPAKPIPVMTAPRPAPVKPRPRPVAAALPAPEIVPEPPQEEGTAEPQVPVAIEGSYDDLSQLSIRPDAQAVIEAKARQRIEEEREDLEDRLRDRVRGLFGRDG